MYVVPLLRKYTRIPNSEPQKGTNGMFTHVVPRILPIQELYQNNTENMI